MNNNTNTNTNINTNTNPYTPPRSKLEASPTRANGGSPLAWEFDYKISAARWVFLIVILAAFAALFGAGAYFNFNATPLALAARHSGRASVVVFAILALLCGGGAVFCAVRLVGSMGEAPLVVRVGETSVRVPHPSRHGELLELPYATIRKTIEVKRRTRFSHQFIIISTRSQVRVMSVGFRSAREFAHFRLALAERLGWGGKK